MISRRSLLTGIIAAACAPAIARAGILMPIKPSLALVPRNVVVYGSAGVLFTVTGTDAYGMPVTEVIDLSGGAGTTKHAYKTMPHVSVMNLGAPVESIRGERVPVIECGQREITKPLVTLSYDTFGQYGKNDGHIYVGHGDREVLSGSLPAGESWIYESPS